MGRAHSVLALLAFALIGNVSAATTPGVGKQVTRQLQQVDAWAQYMDTSPPPVGTDGTTPSDAPAVNTAGVPAAANSATQVPVLGSPYSAYAPQQPTLTAQQQALYQQQLAAQQQQAYQQQLAAQQQQALAAQQQAGFPTAVVPAATAAEPAAPTAAQPGATISQPLYAPSTLNTAAATPAAATPAAAPVAQEPAVAPAAVPEPAPEPVPEPAPVPAPAPAPKPPVKAPEPPKPSPPPPKPPSPAPSPPPPSPPPPNPPPPYPPGMIQRSELTNQIPANATALKTTKILLPEGASKNFTFAWVCDAKGGLYLSVNKNDMITCGKGTIDLSQTLKIKGAKPITCPDTRKACPGNTAVTIFSKFANTAEQFKAKQPAYIAGVAKAASVSPMQVVVTSVKLLYTPKPPAPEPAAAEAPAAAPAAPNVTKPISKPAAAAAAAPTNKTGTIKPESAPLRRLLATYLRRLLAEEAAPPAKAPEKKPSLDAAAVVEELPGGPKPMIEVMTSIQPLTEEEAQSVKGTTGSPYFITTFRETLADTNLTMTEDIAVKIAEPQKEYIWPEPEKPKVNATAKTNTTTRGILPITDEVPTVDVITPDNVTATTENTTTTANTTQPKSSAGSSSVHVFATAAVAVFAAVLAF